MIRLINFIRNLVKTDGRSNDYIEKNIAGD